MPFSTLVRSLYLLLACATYSHAQAVTTCPNSETTFTAPSGLVYKTCIGTDYEGPTYNILPNIADAAACVQLCAQDTANACDKSVYDTSNRDCHLKGSDTYSLLWTNNARFTASRRVTTGNVGKWGPLVNLPVIPVAAYVVPTQPERLLVFSACCDYNFGGAGGLTQYVFPNDGEM